MCLSSCTQALQTHAHSMSSSPSYATNYKEERDYVFVYCTTMSGKYILQCDNPEHLHIQPLHLARHLINFRRGTFEKYRTDKQWTTKDFASASLNHQRTDVWRARVWHEGRMESDVRGTRDCNNGPSEATSTWLWTAISVTVGRHAATLAFFQASNSGWS